MQTRLLVTLFLLVTSAVAETQPQLNLMPMPSKLQVGAGQLQIPRSFSVAISGNRDTILERGVQRFVRQLSRQTGMLLLSAGSGTPTLVVSMEHGSQPIQQL